MALCCLLNCEAQALNLAISVNKRRNRILKNDFLFLSFNSHVDIINSLTIFIIYEIM